MRLARPAALGGITALMAGGAIAIAATNNISTVAGTETAGYNGEGIAASSAQLATPTGVAALPGGGYVFSDQGNSRVRRVGPDGVITTIAGSGTAGFSGDNGPATQAQLSAPNGLAVQTGGGVLFADSNNNRVRRVATDGTITTVAGGGTGGDGGAATNAILAFPAGVAVQADGGYLIADNDNRRIRRVDPNGIISTVAGNGQDGATGDGGPATSAPIGQPMSVAVTSDGGFIFTDEVNNRVRRVAPDGTISTVAGTGAAGSTGDGGPATAATLNTPIGVRGLADGGFLVAERAGNRIRRVDPSGIINTVAGTGTAGFSGDGGLATAAQLNQPFDVSATGEGDYLIADTFNSRIRLVDAGDASPPPAPGLPRPVLGRTVNVSVVSGRVRIAVPQKKNASAAQKGLRFVPLRAARQIPVGSFLDTKRGTVRLVSATANRSKTQAGRFTSGVFQVLQSRKRSAKGLTELRLKGASFRRCGSARGSDASAALSRRAIRRLRANAKGRFRTRGRYSAATVRGTQWLTVDRCDGTLTKVTRGRVAVRDFRRKKTILVRRGKSYLAKARVVR